ncbi:uncharacterized protein DS421_1g28880 [Arachis hypogaea]|nr:uncharacterized protein DS421_1g28880 [Arachis hypogaea]
MAEEACPCLVTEKELFVIKLSNLKKEEDDIKDWTCLPPPMFEFSLPLPKRDLCPFEFNSKIYMAVSRSKSGSRPIYEFKFEERSILPPESLDVWKELNPPPNYSQLDGRFSPEIDPYRTTFPPQISVPLLSLGSSNNYTNYTVCLTHECEVPPLKTPLERVFAILVNHQNGRVALYQYLDVCLEGIQPRINYGARFNLVDLGNGKLCAMLYYWELDSEPESGALCFSVSRCPCRRTLLHCNLTVVLLPWSEIS